MKKRLQDIATGVSGFEEDARRRMANREEEDRLFEEKLRKMFIDNNRCPNCGSRYHVGATDNNGKAKHKRTCIDCQHGWD